MLADALARTLARGGGGGGGASSGGSGGDASAGSTAGDAAAAFAGGAATCALTSSDLASSDLSGLSGACIPQGQAVPYPGGIDYCRACTCALARALLPVFKAKGVSPDNAADSLAGCDANLFRGPLLAVGVDPEYVFLSVYECDPNTLKPCP
eukprot:scaffold12.g7925.t1